MSLLNIISFFTSGRRFGVLKSNTARTKQSAVNNISEQMNPFKRQSSVCAR